METPVVQERMGLRGFFHVQIEENGKIVGDSGWVKNTVTNLGFNQFLVSSLGSIAGSKYLASMALGTGTEPGAAATTLQGELLNSTGGEVRAALTAATSSGSKTLRLTATFASAASFASASQNISNVGLFAAGAGGTIFAGNTFASSTVATNQNVNATYDIIFS